MLFLKIVGGILALALGIWWGLPGRYEQRPEEIERTMELGIGRTKKVKRYFTPLAWVQRKINVGARTRSERRRGFHMERPEDR